MKEVGKYCLGEEHSRLRERLIWRPRNRAYWLCSRNWGSHKIRGAGVEMRGNCRQITEALHSPCEDLNFLSEMGSHWREEGQWAEKCYIMIYWFLCLKKNRGNDGSRETFLWLLYYFRPWLILAWTWVFAIHLYISKAI